MPWQSCRGRGLNPLSQNQTNFSRRAAQRGKDCGDSSGLKGCGHGVRAHSSHGAVAAGAVVQRGTEGDVAPEGVTHQDRSVRPIPTEEASVAGQADHLLTPVLEAV